MQKNSHLSRRAMLTRGAALAATAFPMVNFGLSQAHAASPRRFATRVVDLVREATVIDMLAPLTLDFRPEVFAEPIGEQWAADFRASGITGFHNSVGIGGPDAYENTLSFLLAWTGFTARNPHVFEGVGRATDLDRAKADGKCAVIMGLQNSDHFRTAADVKTFYQLGQRVSQLTYNSQNLIGAGCTDRIDGGLSDYGVQIVAEMDKVGMLVDTSHCGDKTTLDAIAAAEGPIAITHSNVRALNNHPRTKTDEAIRALGAKGGVMGITGVRNFLTAKEPTTVANIVDQIDHVGKLIGFDKVGIGSDADLYGYDDMEPKAYAQLKAAYKGSYAFRDKIDTDGFDDPLKFYSLTEEMVRRGYSDEQVHGVLGANFRRLLGQVWK